MRITHKELTKSLESELEKVYTIYGDETLFIQETLEKIRVYAAKQGYEERSTQVVTKDFNWSKLNSDSENRDMFSSKKIVELKMLGVGPGVAGSKALIEYIQNPNQDQILILTAEGLDKKSSSSAWAKEMELKGAFITIPKLRSGEIIPWIVNRAKNYHLEIENDAAQFLSEMTEGNLISTLQEVHKISLIYPNEKIDLKKMANSISNTSRYGVFDFTDAFINGDKKRTVQILEYFKMEGTSELQILSLISKELGNLFLLKISGNTDKIYGPKFYKDKLKTASNNLTLEQIRNGLLKISEVDAAIKGQGHQEKWQGLRQLSQIFFSKKLN